MAVEHGPVPHYLSILGARKLLPSLLATIEQACVLFDDTKQILYANRAAHTLFAADQLVGTSIDRYLEQIEGTKLSMDLLNQHTSFTRLTLCVSESHPKGADGLTPEVTSGRHNPTYQLVQADYIFTHIRKLQGPVKRLGQLNPLSKTESHDSVQRLHALVFESSDPEDYSGRHDRLVSELRRANARLKSALSIVSSTYRTNGILPHDTHMLDTLCSVIDCDGSTLYLLEQGQLRLKAHSSQLQEISAEGHFLRLGHGLPGLIQRARKPMRLRFVTPNRVLCLESSQEYEITSPLARHFQTVLGVPVMSNDKVIAVIIVGWKRARAVTRNDVSLLETIAEYLSIELMATLASSAQRRSEELNYLLTEISNIIYESSALDVDLLLNILKQIHHHIPFDIWLLDHQHSAVGGMPIAIYDDAQAGERTMEFPFKSGADYPGRAGAFPIAEDSPISEWLAQVTGNALTHGIIVSLGSIAGEENLEFLALRPPTMVPFDNAEVVFLKRFVDVLRKSIVGEIERSQDARIAHALQQSLKNEIEEIPGVYAGALYSSATDRALIGGDFYDMVSLPNDQVLVFIGDISGKGIEAASMSSLVKTAVVAYAYMGMSPARIVSSVNKLFVNFSRLERFATLFVAICSLRTGQATYCCAGHTPTYFYQQGTEPKTGELTLLSEQSPIVGAFSDVHFKNGRFSFNPHDILFLYTDGAYEARGKTGEFFGEDRLRRAFLTEVDAHVEDLPERILTHVETFTDGLLMDDIALLAIKFDNKEYFARDAKASRGY